MNPLVHSTSFAPTSIGLVLEYVRLSGEFNMIMQWEAARAKAYVHWAQHAPDHKNLAAWKEVTFQAYYEAYQVTRYSPGVRTLVEGKTLPEVMAQYAKDMPKPARKPRAKKAAVVVI